MMDEQDEPKTIAEKLDLISEFQAQADLLDIEHKRLLDELLPPEVKAAISSLNAEFSGKAEIVLGKIAQLKAEIEEELKAGQPRTEKGDYLSATLIKGRITWDAKILDGFALSHPEILIARKEGQPYVTFKATK